VVPFVPITNQNDNVPMWSIKRNWNNSPVVYNKAAKSTRSSLHMESREVKETPYLIFNLKLVSPVPLWGNWTVSTKNPILPWTSPLLNSRPITSTIKFQSVKEVHVTVYTLNRHVISRFTSKEPNFNTMALQFTV